MTTHRERRCREIKIFSSKSTRRTRSDGKQQPLEVTPRPKKTAVKTETAAAKPRKAKKPRKKSRVFVTVISILLILAGLYTFVVYTNIPFIKSLRDAYIETAMTTMTHTWLAEWFFPQSVIDEVMQRMEAEKQSQIGKESKWKDDSEIDNKDEKTIFDVFDELDEDSYNAYLKAHPRLNKDDWHDIYINEAGLDDDGTTIKTKQGDQVLAIDAANGILLVRIKGSSYMGVLAICKNASELRCCAAAHIGAYGELLGDLVDRCDGVLGVNASGFADENGVGSGGQINDYSMCEGVEYGTHNDPSRKRIELRNDDKFYVVDSNGSVDPDTRDAVEFSPALIVDGDSLIGEQSSFTSIQPRTVVGQEKDGDILLLVIEGRLVGRSLGIGLPDCTRILESYDCYQALNMDGGTSAIMWFHGEYVTECSNPEIICRYLPNAWVYGYAS